MAEEQTAELTAEERAVCAGLGITPAQYTARKTTGEQAPQAADAARRFSEREVKHDSSK